MHHKSPARAAQIAILLLTAGCAGPLEAPRAQSMRDAVSAAAQREIDAVGDSPGVGRRTITRQPSSLDFSPERMRELEEMAGPASYTAVQPPVGLDLAGEQSDQVAISLQRAVASAVEHNLAVESARYVPAINEANVVLAEAAFDWVFFSNLNWNNVDEPTFVPIIGGNPVSTGATVNESLFWDTGLRRRLTSGANLSVSQSITYSDDSSPGVTLFPDPGFNTAVNVGLSQPLLRGFGADVNLAQVRLARNTERASVQNLRDTLINTVTQTESAYWDLYRARERLKIAQRLVDRGEGTRKVLEGRLDFDVRPAEFSDAVARVESRKADVIRAQRLLRDASDRLKVLVNDPSIAIGDETLIIPLNSPNGAPVEFGLLDAVLTAVNDRPDVQRAVLSIDDAAIREQVAANARLPLLDLSVRATLQGLTDDLGESYEDVGESRFVNFLVGVAFEQALGNRAGEAAFRGARLARMQSVINYRAAVQNAVFEIKSALRDVVTNYQLIEQTRASRLAAAENLRALLVEEEKLRGLTPDFLNLKLNRQEALANAEIQELNALIDYQLAIARIYDAMGTSLERNQIEFVVPDNPER